MEYKFRTILTYDPQVHAEKEVFTEPSLTDPTEYESLEQILIRCMRGDMSRVIEGNDEGFDENATDEEIINSMSPQDHVNFDISDQTDINMKAQELLKKEKEKIKKGAKAPESSKPEENKEPSDNANVVSSEGSAT